ncbi:MAG: cysteine desulfurase, partial [Oscillospiraceae bacterium]|nr:cysteine desulfurase [Oscillospiraceae bacterium]
MEEIYLDNSATTPTDPEVAQLALKMMCENYGNPSSLHRKGFDAQLAVDKAREQVAAVLSADPRRIVFTANGTEANNLAICGTAQALRRAKGRMVVGAAEHASVGRAMDWCESEGWEVIRIAPNPDGTPDLAAFAAAVNEHTALVSCMAVNSETGALTDIKALSKAVKAKNPKTLVHCDAVQAFGRIRLNPKAMGIDLLSASGHKINAPKGVGMLYMAQGVRLVPLIHGSSQEGGLHPGTEHVPNIAAFGLAAEKMDRSREKLWKQYTALKEDLTEKLGQMDGVCINSPQNAVPYILNLSVPGYRSEILIHYLERLGIYVSSGSACAKG